MKITVINGTEVKGCTYSMKEIFLEGFRDGNEITEYYLPKDLPHFCCGCKACFLKSEAECPHAQYVRPIWASMLASDMLVFASPVYALRTTAQMKSLLDHLCVHWMVHRPDEKMFSKRAVVLTNAIGVFNGGAQKDIATSLRWLGVSQTKKLGVGLLEGVVWDELSEKRRGIITRKVKTLAKKSNTIQHARKGIPVRFLFAALRMMHQNIGKKEIPLSADNQYWKDRGWIHID